MFVDYCVLSIKTYQIKCHICNDDNANMNCWDALRSILSDPDSFFIVNVFPKGIVRYNGV